MIQMLELQFIPPRKKNTIKVMISEDKSWTGSPAIDRKKRAYETDKGRKQEVRTQEDNVKSSSCPTLEA